MPDLKKFHGGDFNRSYTLIPVGEKEAEKHIDAIWKALQKLGISKRVEKSRPSILPDDFDFRTWVDIPSDIVIDRVRIEGLERYSQEVFYSAIGKVRQQADIVSKTGKRIWPILCGPDYFKTVDYEVIYHEDYTELVFQVLENPPSELKIGLHYDNDFGVAALTEFAHQNAYGPVAEFYFRGLLGNLKLADMNLIFRSSRRLGFFGEIQGWNQDRLYFQNGQHQDTYNEKRFRARLGMQVLFHSWGGFKVGHQVEHIRIRDADSSIGNVSKYLPAVWLSAGIDTRDDAFLTRHGVYVQTQAKWVHRTFSHKQVQTQLAYFTSPHPQLSVGFWSHGGYMTQSAPIYEHFALGGAGHFSNAALRVVGLKRDKLRAFRFVSARISIWSHMKFWGSIPLSAVGIFYQGGLYNNTDQPNTRIHGFGIGGYISTTFLGPIRIDAVSTEEKDIRIYTSVGFAFLMHIHLSYTNHLETKGKA